MQPALFVFHSPSCYGRKDITRRGAVDKIRSAWPALFIFVWEVRSRHVIEQAPIEKIPPDRWCHAQAADILNETASDVPRPACCSHLEFKKHMLIVLENLTQLGMEVLGVSFFFFFKENPFPLEIACFVKSLLSWDQQTEHAHKCHPASPG